jgi:hypothetical protein
MCGTIAPTSALHGSLSLLHLLAASTGRARRRSPVRVLHSARVDLSIPHSARDKHEKLRKEGEFFYKNEVMLVVVHRRQK